MEIISDSYDGKRRKLCSAVCIQCQKSFFVPKHVLGRRRFCSRKCCSENSSKSFLVLCEYCKKSFYKKRSTIKNSVHGKFFCSRACKDIAQSFDGSCVEIRPKHYTNGKFSYRERALRVYGKVCNFCGYMDKCAMLDVHHIDGNRENNNIGNLEVLCVWCHALYTRKILKGSSPNRDGTSLAPKKNMG